MVPLYADFPCVDVDGAASLNRLGNVGSVPHAAAGVSAVPRAAIQREVVGINDSDIPRAIRRRVPIHARDVYLAGETRSG